VIEWASVLLRRIAVPPSREALRRAIERHFACWNARDREGWIGLFDPQVQFDDPVGVPTKHGLEAARRQWDASFTPGQRWRINPGLTYYRGSDAASVVRNQGVIGDKRFDFETIEVWTLGENGKFVAVRGYYDPPAEVDGYFHAPEDMDRLDGARPA
jgi:ketosteroid isomerase-like protein